MKVTIFLILFMSFLLIFSPVMGGGVKQLREENEALKSQLDSAVSRISETETRIQKLQSQLTAKDQELEKMQADLDALGTKLQELEDLLRKEGSELLQEVIGLREKRVILEERIEKFETDIAISSKQIEQLDRLVRDYEKKLKENYDENLNLTRQINDLEKGIDGLRKSLSAQNEDYSRQIAQLNTEKQSLKGEISRLEGKVNDLTGALTEQSSQTSEQLADLTSRNNELEAEVLNLRQSVDSLKNALAESEAKYSKHMDQVLTEKWNLEKQVVQMNSEKRGLENQIGDLKRELDAKLAAEAADKERMKKTYDQLVSSLKNEVGEKTIEILNFQNALTINIMDKIFFDSGKTVIKPEGLDVLRRVGAIIKDLPDKVIRIEGHTDDVPIGPKIVSVYPTNWELGAARASNVAEYFRTKAGIIPERLMVVSYSMYKPIVPNTSEEHRARNRRIEIILQDMSLYDMIMAVESE